jgi:hypothetical protein
MYSIEYADQLRPVAVQAGEFSVEVQADHLGSLAKALRLACWVGCCASIELQSASTL